MRVYQLKIDYEQNLIYKPVLSDIDCSDIHKLDDLEYNVITYNELENYSGISYRLSCSINKLDELYYTLYEDINVQNYYKFINE